MNVLVCHGYTICVGVCACHVYTVRYHRKRTSDPLELELRVIVSPPVGVLGTELGKSCKLSSAEPPLQPLCCALCVPRSPSVAHFLTGKGILAGFFHSHALRAQKRLWHRGDHHIFVEYLNS